MESSSNGARLDKIRRKLEQFEENGYDKSYEEEWKGIFDSLVEIKTYVDKEKIFSDNEEFSDIKTEDLKYVLISYYQSELVQKVQTNRKNMLTVSLKFYTDFYKLVKSYNYLSKDQIKYYESLTRKDEDDEEKKDKKPDFAQMSMERQRKIEMYKYKKALSEKIKKIEKEEDFDDSREYWIDYLNLCIVKMYENIKMVNLEIDSLAYMEKMKKQDVPKEPPKNQKPKEKMEVLKIKSPEDLLNIDPNNKLAQNLNFVTTSTNENCVECFNSINGLQTVDQQIVAQLPENIRKNVFRNANPTEMTMEEFAQMQMKHMHEAHEKQQEHKKEDEDSDNEEVSDKKTYKARDWDDWKDDHPKGSGNRMGK